AAARARVEAAAARIGAAKADFYPNINLTAFLGFDALTLHGLDLFSAGSRTGGVGPAIHLPVFEAGRLQASLRGRYGEYDAALAQYNQALLEALRQVADQITSLRAVRGQLAEQANALAAVFILAGIGSALWWWLDGRWYQATDDAYVRGNLVQLTPQIAGIVVRINADDTALVRAGEAVVELDRADTQTALAQAKAALAQSVRRVRQLYANADVLRANVALREAELRRAQEDLARRTGLPDARAVAEEDVKHAQAQADTAAAALAAA